MKKIILIILLISISMLFIVSSEPQKIDLKVNEKLKTNEKVDVTISLKDKNNLRSLKDLEITYKSDLRNVVSARVSKKDLEKLQEDKNILQVKPRLKLRTFLQDSTIIINSTLTWPIQILGINLTGENETICIIDSGINYTHSALGSCTREEILEGNCGKVVGGFAFYNNVNEDKSDVMGDSDHGTHVAGIAAGNGTITGVAPDAKIVALKACGPTSNCDTNAFIDSLSWCVNNASLYNISVISLSLGSDTLYPDYCDSEDVTTTNLVNAAVLNNISVVAATGNDGNASAIAWPACIENVTAVGGSDKSDDMYSDGNRNNLTDLLGPGVDINSSILNGGFGSLTGTSMATPHVSGAFILINQFYRLQNNTSPTPSEIQDVLNNTAKIIYDAASGLNFSRIDVYTAIKYLDGSSPEVGLENPTDNSLSLELNQTFSCNASDVSLSNVTLYIWNSSQDVVNQTTTDISENFNESSFNVTLDYDTYEWNCLAEDFKGLSAFASSNFTLTIGGISTGLISPATENFTNINETNFSCTSASEEAYSLENVTFYLWNSTGLEYSEEKNISGLANTSEFNYTFDYEDDYQWNCLSINNNTNSSLYSSNYTITYDSTVPNIDLDSPEEGSSAATSYNFTFNVSDANNISSCELIFDDAVIHAINDVDKTITNEMYNESFSVGSHTWSVNCTDIAGNTGNSTRTLTITQESSNNEGSSGGGSVTYRTYSPSTEQITLGYTEELKTNEKITFTSGKQEHTLTVNAITKDSINITIKSNETKIILLTEQSKKLNLSSSDYYDLYVRLNSIVNSKANLTIKTIYELIEKPKEKEENKTEEKEPLKIIAFDEDTKDGIFDKVKYYLIVIITVAVISVVIIISTILIKKKHKKRETLKKYKEKFKKNIKPKK